MIYGYARVSTDGGSVDAQVTQLAGAEKVFWEVAGGAQTDTWADTTTAHGRLMLTMLGSLAEFERELIRARTGEGQGARAEPWPPVQAHLTPEERSHRAA